MTIDEQLIDSFLQENDRRWERLRADYNPVTGEGAPGERVRLELPDFAIPVQYIPKRMMRNKFVRNLAKAGSIKKFLEKYPNDQVVKTPHDVEILLRRIRHKYDFTFWAYFCFPIISKEGGEVRFKLNRPQLEVNDMVQAQQDNEEPINVVICKARQWGGSTYSIAKQTQILFKHDPYHSFVVAAHVQGAAENILRMLRHAISKYPAWDLGLPENESLTLAPAGKAGNAYCVKDSKGNQVLPGIIYIGSAQYPDSLRSPAIRGAHLSEVGVWPDTPERRPESMIATMCGGLIGRPFEMQIMESTAKSTDDFFHEVYTSAKKVGRSIFIPWFHIPHDTLKIKDTRKFVEWLIKNKDNDRPEGKWKDSGKHYWWLWTLGATLEGINWYRYKRLDPMITTYAQMANEAPSTDVEAFQAAGQHVFDIYQVEAMRKFVKKPYKVGRLISNDCRTREVLQGIQFIEQANGNLKVWEFPDDSPVKYRYLVSVDIGGAGPKSDFHSVRVFDRLLMHKDFNGIPSVVAEMHYHCSRDDLAYDAMRLAEWYGHALLVFESNTYELSDKNRNVEGDGSQYILDIAADIYSNLYARETPPEQMKESPATKWGFRTGPDTKPKIIDLARWAIEYQKWAEPCEDCLDEFSMYIQDGNKFTAPPKKHDDELMATCIGLWVCYREMPMPEWIEDIPDGQHEEKTFAHF